jgi:type II secretory pathway predicted ATPase ExeA
MKINRHISNQPLTRAKLMERLRNLQIVNPEDSMPSPTIDTAANAEQHRVGPAGPVGPLNILHVANRLGISLQDIASAGGCAKSTAHGIINRGAWPRRMVINLERIHKTFEGKGATADELETLFDAAPVPIKSAASTKPPKPTPDDEDDTMLMGKQTLTPAARKAFGLFTNPFDGDVTSEDEMFVSSEIRFVREACLQTALGGAFVAIVGESGAGKTTILGDLKDRVAGSARPVIMIEPSVVGLEDTDGRGKTIKSSDILYAGVATLDQHCRPAHTTEGRTRQFLKLLQDSVDAGNNHMLVLEEAHSLPITTLKHLKRLHERTRIGRKPALGILLLAHPELREKLNPRRHDVREVFQRCEIIELQPLDGDLGSYLDHRVKLAGKALADIITDDGIAEIRARLTVERRSASGNGVVKISKVYPLAVNNLMIASMNVAAELGVPIVNRDIVRGV